jgi:hypothetical protein
MIEPAEDPELYMQIVIILSVFGIWLIIISIILYRIFALFNKLTKGVGVSDLKSILGKVLVKETGNEKSITELTKKINEIELDGKLHVQKVGLIRFNPFKELGGDHSFSLAILDGEDNGVVITSLHTRDRTRVYMKAIKNKKSDPDLSEEEKKALVKAK